MKLSLLALVLTLLAPCVRGNVYIPDARLSGETVHVRMGKDSAAITALFAFEHDLTRNDRTFYFPIFSDDNSTSAQVLAIAGLELEVDGKKQSMATPCDTPNGLKGLPSTPRIYWFSANLDDLIEDSGTEAIDKPITIRVSYSQARIHGSVHYLPIIIGGTGSLAHRSWNYQLHAHSGARVTRVISKGTDYEQIADSVVVYLKDRELVELK